MRNIAFNIFRRWTIRLALFWLAYFLLFSLVAIPLALLAQFDLSQYGGFTIDMPGAAFVLRICARGNVLETLLIIFLSALIYALLALLIRVFVRRQLKRRLTIATSLSDFERLRDALFAFRNREGRFPDSLEELKDERLTNDFTRRGKTVVRFLSNLNVGVVAMSSKLWRSPFFFRRHAFVILEEGTIVDARGRALNRLLDVIWASKGRGKDVGRFHARDDGRLRFERGKEFASAFCPLNVVAVMPVLALSCLVFCRRVLHYVERYDVFEGFMAFAGSPIAYSTSIFFLGFLLLAVLILALSVYAGWLHYRAGLSGLRNVLPVSFALLGTFLFCVYLVWLLKVISDRQSDVADMVCSLAFFSGALRWTSGYDFLLAFWGLLLSPMWVLWRIFAFFL